MIGDVIQYRRGYKGSLWETYRVQTSIVGFSVTHRLFTLTPDGWLTVFEDYPWDFASGPTWDTPSSIRGSLVHDALYEMMRLGLLPQSVFHKVNAEFRKILLEDGMYQWRANLWFSGVEKFGNPNCAVKAEPILFAPFTPKVV